MRNDIFEDLNKERYIHISDVNSFKVITAATGRICLALKKKYGVNFSASFAASLLGCSSMEFIKHLESQFKNEMSWDNYGIYGWTMDHIRPIKSIDWENKEDILAVFNHKNIQPILHKEHISKSINDMGFKDRKEKNSYREYRKIHMAIIREQVIDFAIQGYSYSAIGRILNMRTETVSRICRKYIISSEDISKPVSVS